MTRIDSASRVLHAAAARVFDALLDPAAIAAWLPPTGMTGRFERFDARPGGSYRMVLSYDDAGEGRGKTTGDSDVVEVRFLDIVPNEGVVQAVDFVSADPALSGTMTMRWMLHTIGGSTRVEILAEDVPDGISAEDHQTGMASSLAKLAEYLETRASAPS